MYKTMYQKYQIDDGKGGRDVKGATSSCKDGYMPQTQYYSKKTCEKIPAQKYKKPRYKNIPTRENYQAANITLEDTNSCHFFDCPPKSENNFGGINQLPTSTRHIEGFYEQAPLYSFYNIGPHARLSNPIQYIYSMPNPDLVYGSYSCPENLPDTPWYGTYDAQ